MTENERFVRAVAALIAKCDDKAKLFFMAHQTLEAMQAMDATARATQKE